jgi:hypothetical protein
VPASLSREARGRCCRLSRRIKRIPTTTLPYSRPSWSFRLFINRSKEAYRHSTYFGPRFQTLSPFTASIVPVYTFILRFTGTECVYPLNPQFLVPSQRRRCTVDTTSTASAATTTQSRTTLIEIILHAWLSFLIKIPTFELPQTLTLDTQQNQEHEWIQSCFMSSSVYMYMCNDNTCETRYRACRSCRKGRYLGTTGPVYGSATAIRLRRVTAIIKTGAYIEVISCGIH